MRTIERSALFTGTVRREPSLGTLQYLLRWESALRVAGRHLSTYVTPRRAFLLLLVPRLIDWRQLPPRSDIVA